jgi:hypothetical protein
MDKSDVTFTPEWFDARAREYIDLAVEYRAQGDLGAFSLCMLTAAYIRTAGNDVNSKQKWVGITSKPDTSPDICPDA